MSLYNNMRRVARALSCFLILLPLAGCSKKINCMFYGCNDGDRVTYKNVGAENRPESQGSDARAEPVDIEAIIRRIEGGATVKDLKDALAALGKEISDIKAQLLEYRTSLLSIVARTEVLETSSNLHKLSLEVAKERIDLLLQSKSENDIFYSQTLPDLQKRLLDQDMQMSGVKIEIEGLKSEIAKLTIDLLKSNEMEAKQTADLDQKITLLKERVSILEAQVISRNDVVLMLNERDATINRDINNSINLLSAMIDKYKSSTDEEIKNHSVLIGTISQYLASLQGDNGIIKALQDLGVKLTSDLTTLTNDVTNLTKTVSEVQAVQGLQVILTEKISVTELTRLTTELKNLSTEYISNTVLQAAITEINNKITNISSTDANLLAFKAMLEANQASIAAIQTEINNGNVCKFDSIAQSNSSPFITIKCGTQSFQVNTRAGGGG